MSEFDKHSNAGWGSRSKTRKPNHQDVEFAQETQKYVDRSKLRREGKDMVDDYAHVIEDLRELTNIEAMDELDVHGDAPRRDTSKHSQIPRFGLDYDLLSHQKREQEEQERQRTTLSSIRGTRDAYGIPTYFLSSGDQVHFRDEKTLNIFRQAVELPLELRSGSRRISTRFHRGRTGFVFNCDPFEGILQGPGLPWYPQPASAALIPSIITRAADDCPPIPDTVCGAVDPAVILNIADAFSAIRSGYSLNSSFDPSSVTIGTTAAESRSSGFESFISYDATVIASLAEGKATLGGTDSTVVEDDSYDMFADVGDYVPSYKRESLTNEKNGDGPVISALTSSKLHSQSQSLLDDLKQETSTTIGEVDDTKSTQSHSRMKMGSAVRLPAPKLAASSTSSSVARAADPVKPSFSFLQDEDDMFGEYFPTAQNTLDPEQLKAETRKLLLAAQSEEGAGGKDAAKYDPAAYQRKAEEQAKKDVLEMFSRRKDLNIAQAGLFSSGGKTPGHGFGDEAADDRAAKRMRILSSLRKK